MPHLPDASMFIFVALVCSFGLSYGISLHEDAIIYLSLPLVVSIYSLSVSLKDCAAADISVHVLFHTFLFVFIQEVNYF